MPGARRVQEVRCPAVGKRERIHGTRYYG
jgi:hypothetical protein